MACHSPIQGYRAKSPNPKTQRHSLVFSPRLGLTDQPMDVPCGQCIACRLERSRQWAMRSIHEMRMHSSNSFLTLTYKPTELPAHGSLNKRHLQLFFKKYRRYLGSTKIRYLACGEYGEHGTIRPHYHAIIFGHDFTDKKIKFKTKSGHTIYTSATLESLWGLGQCSIGEANFETAAYVARYVTKKITGKKAEEHYGVLINKETGEITPRRIPEFISPSRRPGIGKSWYDKFGTEIYPRDEVLMRELLMQPPKFYDRLHLAQDPEGHEEIQAARKLAASKNPDNNFPRRQVLAEIAKQKFKQLKRDFEK